MRKDSSILCNELNCKKSSIIQCYLLMLIADDMKITHVLIEIISGDKKKSFSAKIFYTILTQKFFEVENLDKK